MMRSFTLQRVPGQTFKSGKGEEVGQSFQLSRRPQPGGKANAADGATGGNKESNNGATKAKANRGTSQRTTKAKFKARTTRKEKAKLKPSPWIAAPTHRKPHGNLLTSAEPHPNARSSSSFFVGRDKIARRTA